MGFVFKLLGIIILLFILGVSSGVYNGNELKYPGINISNTTNNSEINIGIYKIVDGIMQITYEFANVVGKEAIKNKIDLNKIIKWVTWGIWIIVILFVLKYSILLFVYIYIIREEIKMSKKEKEEISQYE